jgi:hypothetical protein
MKLYGTLYHGTASSFDVVDVFHNLGDATLEFGYGFYTTTDMETAKGYARLHSDIEGLIGRLYVYEFDFVTAKDNLDILEFKSPNIDWYKYILQNQTGFIDKTTDIVIGPLVTDSLWKILEDASNNLIGQEEAELLIANLSFEIQVVFKSEASMRYLQKTAEEIIEEV